MWPFKTIFSQTWGDGRQENSTNEWKAQRWKLLLEMPMKQKWRKCWWLLEAERKYNHSETIRFEAAHRQCMMQYIDSLSVYESVHWHPVSVLSSTLTACQCIKQYMDSLSVYEARTEGWKCDECQNIDSEEHLLWCKGYEGIREHWNLYNEKDLSSNTCRKLSTK